MYERYKALRDARGVSDYRVCVETGLSPSRLSDWKNGRCKPNLSNLLKIARFFGVSVGYFLDGGEG